MVWLYGPGFWVPLDTTLLWVLNDISGNWRLGGLTAEFHVWLYYIGFP